MNNTAAYVFIAVAQVIVWSFFGLRIYVRQWIVKKVSWDDLLVGLGVLFYAAFAITAVGVIANGLGTTVDEDPSSIDVWSRGTLYFFLSETFFVLDSTLLRIACGAMLLRVVGPAQGALKWTICVTVAVMTLYSTAFYFLSVFQCWPVSYFWRYMYPGAQGRCIDNEHLTSKWTVMSIFFTVHSVVCVLSDWILGAVPFILLRGVQISFARKFVVLGLLSLGILAGVVALARAPLIMYANNLEFWDYAIPVAATTVVEPVLGIVAMCSSTLMPLFRNGHSLASQDRGTRTGHTKSRSGADLLTLTGGHALPPGTGTLSKWKSIRRLSRSGSRRVEENKDGFEMHGKPGIIVRTSFVVHEDREDSDETETGSEKGQPTRRTLITGANGGVDSAA